MLQLAFPPLKGILREVFQIARHGRVLVGLGGEFDLALANGRKAIAAYLDALRSGDAGGAKKLAGGVKNAYKQVWALDPK